MAGWSVPAFPSRVGVWWTSDSWPIGAVLEVAREIEQLGFGSLFYGEAAHGKESLTQAGALLSATSRLVVGTGIANIHARDPIAAEAGGRTLSAQYPGRFVLGLGVSHAPLVAMRPSGGTYRSPLATMRSYLEGMDSLGAGTEPGAERPPRIVAALGPKMIELAGSAADGAIPFQVTPEWTRTTRELLGPGKLLVCQQSVALGTGDDARARARANVTHHLELPNYRNSWLRQGFGEADLADGGSGRLVEALVATGDPEAIGRRVAAQLAAGADQVVVQVAGDDFAADPRPALRSLAGALTGL